jgi:hypothetical protein
MDQKTVYSSIMKMFILSLLLHKRLHNTVVKIIYSATVLHFHLRFTLVCPIIIVFILSREVTGSIPGGANGIFP